MLRARFFPAFLSLAAALLLLSAAAPSVERSEGFAAALSAVSAARISARIQFLADDLLEGRGTGARGSEIAARYIATEFAADGLKPAGDAGSYLQNFELIGVASDPASTLAFETPKGTIDLKNGENSVLSSRNQQSSFALDAPVVFAGFGITAPDEHWDDYAGLDVSDKLVVCLIGEPPSDDPAFFAGRALTYYGRWTYKYEEAARRHARGLLIVHTDALAPYGWQVIRNSWSGEQAQLPLAEGRTDLTVAGYITHATARTLFENSGLDFDALAGKAGQRGFRGMPLEGTRARGGLRFKVRRYRTENVAGVLEGSDPATKDTCILLSAHFDHLGIGAPDKRGDTIYNGAIDNASGTATLLEIARAAADGRWKPRRSILFMAVTAEEQGLLGSAYAAKHPPMPIGKIAANLNMDVTPVYGEMEDFSLLGLDHTTLEPLAREVARQMRVRLDPEPHPEQGAYFRSDHFSFARAGVPALSVDAGQIVRGHDAAYGEKLFTDYNDNHYHQPSDEFDPHWDLSGTVQEARLVMRLADAIARAPKMPSLKPGEKMSRAIAESR